MDSVSLARGEAMLSGLHSKNFIGGFREVMEKSEQSDCR